MNTEWGRVMSTLNEDNEEDTPLQVNSQRTTLCRKQRDLSASGVPLNDCEKRALGMVDTRLKSPLDALVPRRLLIVRCSYFHLLQNR